MRIDIDPDADLALATFYRGAIEVLDEEARDALAASPLP